MASSHCRRCWLHTRKNKQVAFTVCADQGKRSRASKPSMRAHPPRPDTPRVTNRVKCFVHPRNDRIDAAASDIELERREHEGAARNGKAEQRTSAPQATGFLASVADSHAQELPDPG